MSHIVRIRLNSNIKKIFVLFLLIISIFVNLYGAESFQKSDKELVIMLHGLGRASASFNKAEKALKKEGYVVYNIDYPSTFYTIEDLCEKILNDKFIKYGIKTHKYLIIF